MAAPVSYQLFVGSDVAAATFTAAWGRRVAEITKPVTLAQAPEG
jgi:hypothetical protein